MWVSVLMTPAVLEMLPAMTVRDLVELPHPDDRDQVT